VDVRTDAGATASILTQYLLEQEVPIPPPVATALYYGIRTDTLDMSRNVSDLDVKAHRHLLDLVDRERLRAIAHPRVRLAYFRHFRNALSATEIYGSLVLSTLGRVDNPEMVAEVADLLLRLEGITWVVCGGLYENNYYLSVRAAVPGKDAWRLLRDVLHDQGSFGGHGAVAGGRIPLVDDSDRGLKRLELELKKGFLAALGERGTPLVRLEE
jgi:nanoRNase/pAp phosphatase (c-di-AMP/oligoRNAs hydrolase)